MVVMNTSGSADVLIGSRRLRRSENARLSSSTESSHIAKQKSRSRKSLHVLKQQEKSVACTHYTRSYKGAPSLAKHKTILNVKGNKLKRKDITCSVCGTRFHRQADARTHMRTHTGEKPYQCETCNKFFARNSDLRAHERRHTPDDYECTSCTLRFLKKSHLRIHKCLKNRIEHNVGSNFVPLNDEYKKIVIKSEIARLSDSSYSDPVSQDLFQSAPRVDFDRCAVELHNLIYDISDQQGSLSLDLDGQRIDCANASIATPMEPEACLVMQSYLQWSANNPPAMLG